MRRGGKNWKSALAEWETWGIYLHEGMTEEKKEGDKGLTGALSYKPKRLIE